MDGKASTGDDETSAKQLPLNDGIQEVEKVEMKEELGDANSCGKFDIIIWS